MVYSSAKELDIRILGEVVRVRAPAGPPLTLVVVNERQNLDLCDILQFTLEIGRCWNRDHCAAVDLVRSFKDLVLAQIVSKRVHAGAAGPSLQFPGDSQVESRAAE